MQSFPVNYSNHETVYRRLKTQTDRTGWSGQADLVRSLSSLDQMLAWHGVPQRGRSLELGCGAGNVSLHLAKRGWDAHGVDISPTAIAWANENARLQGLAARFVEGSVLTLDGLKDEEFDLVLDGHCFHCIIGRDRPAFLKASMRVLRRDGSLCIRSMCGSVPAQLADRIGYDPVTRCIVQNGFATRHIAAAGELVDEVVSAGFVVAQHTLIPAAADGDLDELLLHAKRP